MDLITFEQMYLCGKNVSLWCDVSSDQSFMVLFLVPAKWARFSSVLYLIAVKGSGVINNTESSRRSLPAFTTVGSMELITFEHM